MKESTARLIQDESANVREAYDKAFRLAKCAIPGMKHGKYTPETTFVFRDNSSVTFRVVGGKLCIAYKF